MKEETIEVDGKRYTISELKYRDVSQFSSEKEIAAKQMMQKSTGITDEEYDNLGMNTGIQLMKAINKLNGIDELDFQKPIQTKS